MEGNQLRLGGFGVQKDQAQREGQGQEDEQCRIHAKHQPQQKAHCRPQVETQQSTAKKFRFCLLLLIAVNQYFGGGGNKLPQIIGGEDTGTGKALGAGVAVPLKGRGEKQGVHSQNGTCAIRKQAEDHHRQSINADADQPHLIGVFFVQANGQENGPGKEQCAAYPKQHLKPVTAQQAGNDINQVGSLGGTKEGGKAEDGVNSQHPSHQGHPVMDDAVIPIACLHCAHLLFHCHKANLSSSSDKFYYNPFGKFHKRKTAQNPFPLPGKFVKNSKQGQWSGDRAETGQKKTASPITQTDGGGFLRFGLAH